jgi:hypothetical protein
MKRNWNMNTGQIMDAVKKQTVVIHLLLFPVSKILEKVIANQLKSFTGKQNMLNNFQFGFRKKKKIHK